MICAVAVRMESFITVKVSVRSLTPASASSAADFLVVRRLDQVFGAREFGAGLDDAGGARVEVVIDAGQDLADIDAVLHRLAHLQVLQARAQHVDGQPDIARRLRLDARWCRRAGWP